MKYNNITNQYLDAFHQLENWHYPYNKTDIARISRQIAEKSGAAFCKIGQKVFENIPMIGIHQVGSVLIPFVISNTKNQFTLRYKDPLGNEISKKVTADLKNQFLKFYGGQVKEYVGSEQREDDGYNSAVFALKNLKTLAECKEEFFKPINRKELLEARKELAKIYTMEIQGFEKNPEKLLELFHPQNEKQLLLIDFGGRSIEQLFEWAMVEFKPKCLELLRDACVNLKFDHNAINQKILESIDGTKEQRETYKLFHKFLCAMLKVAASSTEHEIRIKDVIVSATLEHIPFIGSLMSKVYKYLHEKKDLKAVLNKLAQFESCNAQDAIIQDYAARIVKLEKDQIINGTEGLQLNFKEKLANLKSEFEEQIIGPANWPKSWEILSERYISPFLDYIEKQTKFTDNTNLGIDAFNHYLNSTYPNFHDTKQELEFQAEFQEEEDDVIEIPQDDVVKQEILERMAFQQEKVFQEPKMVEEVKHKIEGKDIAAEKTQIQKEQEWNEEFEEHKDDKKYIFDAARSGNLKLVKYLIEKKGVDVKAKDSDGDSVLRFAAENGKLDVVKYLVEKGADVKAKDIIGYSVLHSAAECGKLDVVKYLVEHGADVKAKDNDGNSVLHYAATSGKLDVVKYLVEELRVDVNAKNEHGYSVLLYATNITLYSLLKNGPSGGLYVLKYLLRNGASMVDCNASNQYQIMKYADKDADLALCITINFFEHKDYTNTTECYHKSLNLVDKIKKTTSLYKIQSKFLSKVISISLDPNFTGNKEEFDKFQKQVFQDKYAQALKLFLTREYEECLNLMSENAQDKNMLFLKQLIEIKQGKEIELHNPSTPDDYYLRGEQAFMQGDSKAALSAYEAALKLDPTFTQALIRKCLITRDYKTVQSIDKNDIPLDSISIMDEIKLIGSIEEAGQKAQNQLVQDVAFDQKLNNFFEMDLAHARKELQEFLKGDHKIIKRIKDGHEKIVGGVFTWIVNFDRINNLQKDLQKFCNEVSKKYKNDPLIIEKVFNKVQQITNYYETFKANYQKIIANTKNPKATYESIKQQEQQRQVAFIDGQYPNKIASHELSKALTDGIKVKQNKYGKHTVVSYPPKGDPEVFFKHNPYAASVEFAVGALYAQFGEKLSPNVKLVKVGGKIFLASEGIKGLNFADAITENRFVQKIDINNFSKLFIGSMLTNPGDLKPDNFIMRINYSKDDIESTELIPIDNDISFCKSGLAFKGKTKAAGISVYSDVLNVLYLLPQMDMKIGDQVKEQLIDDIAPEKILASWLKKLYEQNVYWMEGRGFSYEDVKAFKLPIKLPEGIVIKMYRTLYYISKLIETNSTCQDILKILHPGIAEFYQTNRDNKSFAKSMKQLYIATVEDEKLAEQLMNSLTSGQAYKTMSTLKMMKDEDFSKVFNSTIKEEATTLISVIDFSKSEFLIDIVLRYLYFVTDFTFCRITNSQLEKFIKYVVNDNKIKVYSILLRDPINLNDTTKQKLINLLQSKLEVKTSKSTETDQIDRIYKEFELLQEEKKLTPKDIYDIVASEKYSKDQLVFKICTSINTKDETTGATALSIAASTGNKLAVRILLDLGAHKTLVGEHINDDIRMQIISHENEYFSSLVKQGKIRAASILAKEMRSHELKRPIEFELIKQDKLPIQLAFEDQKYYLLALSLVEKLGSIPRSLIDTLILKYQDDKLLYDVMMTIAKYSQNSFLEKNEFGSTVSDVLYNQQRYDLIGTFIKKGCPVPLPTKMSGCKDILSSMLKAGIKLSKHQWENPQSLNWDSVPKNIKEEVEQFAIKAKNTNILTQMYQNKDSELYVYDTSDGRYFHKFAGNDDLKAMSKICYLLKRNLSIEEVVGAKKIDFLKQDSKGKTLLDCAVNQIETLGMEMMQVLLSKYMNQDVIGTKHNVMYDLAQRGQFQTIAYLQKQNHNLKVCFDGQDQLSPRGYGIKSGQEEYLKLANIPISVKDIQKAKSSSIPDSLMCAIELGGIIDARNWLLNHSYLAPDWQQQLKATREQVKENSPESFALIDLLEAEMALLG